MKQAFNAASFKTIFSLVAGLALAGGFWVASTPMAHGVQKTPAEVIQSQLPETVTISSASDTQLLDAVCKSVRQAPKEAALIVRTAAGARETLRSQILCMGIRCAHDSKDMDCTWVLDVVRDWIKQEPSLANQLAESISDCAPNCRELLQNIGAGGVGEGAFGNPPANINPPPGSVGSGAGASETACTVCHNNQNITLACNDVPGYLQSHPGDTAGACQATPDVNR